ncbi:MAG: class B sortase [Lachnospiraceae bacterium]
MKDDKQTNHSIQHRKIIIGIVLVVLLAVIIVAVWMVRENQKKEEPKKSTAKVIRMKQPESKKKDVENPIDFAALQAQNPDIYAWIRIPDTKVDYPIVQHPTDDIFYLNHNVNKEPLASGALYTELLNRKDFTDFNTVIYGHNMQDAERIMFACLLDYSDPAYFDAHREFFVYTPDQILKYKVFTAYETTDRHIMYSYDFHSLDSYQQYLNELLNPVEQGAIIRNDVNLGIDKQIITLSTCVNGDRPDRRYVVQAVRME